MTADSPPLPKTPRIPVLDVARGVALLAMAIYHFTWDLQFFGYIDAATATSGPLKWFARAIASTFLFLVGVSIVLAHRNGIKWPAFSNRLAQIAAAAALITLVTWTITPGNFVFFGILHHIALASFLALAFLPLPAWTTALAAAAIFATGALVVSPVFDSPFLIWLGMPVTKPVSNDFVPVFPWFSAVLAGMAVTKWALSAGLETHLAAIQTASTPSRTLSFLGRHSLAFYLIHQPVLIGLVAAAAWAFPPDRAEARRAGMLSECEATCGADRSAQFCTAYCGCFLYQLEISGDFDRLYADPSALQKSGRLEELAGICTRQTEAELGANQ